MVEGIAICRNLAVNGKAVGHFRQSLTAERVFEITQPGARKGKRCVVSKPNQAIREIACQVFSEERRYSCRIRFQTFRQPLPGYPKKPLQFL